MPPSRAAKADCMSASARELINRDKRAMPNSSSSLAMVEDAKRVGMVRSPMFYCGAGFQPANSGRLQTGPQSCLHLRNYSIFGSRFWLGRFEIQAFVLGDHLAYFEVVFRAAAAGLAH